MGTYQVCIGAKTGALKTVGGREMAPGSGLQLEGCTVTDTAVTAANASALAWPPATAQQQAQQVNVTRRYSCAGGNATAVSVETFTTDAASGSVRWALNLSSADPGLWTAEITSALGYLRDASAHTKPSLVWLGGPRSNDLPSADPVTFHDPIAPFPIVGAASAATAAVAPKTRPSAGWYAAAEYNAAYGVQTPVPGKFAKVRQLRHQFGPFLCAFPWLYHPTRRRGGPWGLMAALFWLNCSRFSPGAADFSTDLLLSTAPR